MVFSHSLWYLLPFPKSSEKNRPRERLKQSKGISRVCIHELPFPILKIFTSFYFFFCCCHSLPNDPHSAFFLFVFLNKQAVNQTGFPGGTSGREPTCQSRRHGDTSLIPGLGTSPGRGHSNPPQYFCLDLGM